MLKNEIPKPFWYELKHLISVTQLDYEQLYVNPLQKMFNHALTSSTSSDTQQQQEKSLLVLIISALKIRRSYMLPAATDAETCYKQQDAWTYALFTAVLLKKMLSPNTDPVLQAAQWLPAAGIDWLKQYPVLFSAWTECLNSKTSTSNSLTQIIYQAEDALLTKTSVTINPQVTEKNSSNNHAPPIAAEQIDPNIPAAIDTQQESTVSLAETFIAWIKRSVLRKQLAINTSDALLHSVEQGVLLIMPTLYQKFLAVNASVKAAMVNKSEQEAIDLLIKDNRFIPTSTQTGFIHAYYWNEWVDRKVINGLLIKPTALFAPDAMPACNEQLHAEALTGTL